MISMRKVTEATLQPGQIQEEHFSSECIPESALQVNIIDTDNIKDTAVTLAKSVDDLRLHQFIGEETEVKIEGDSWTNVKGARFVKHMFNPSQKMRLIASLKTGDVANTAHLGLNIDGTEYLDLTSISDVYEIVSGEFDISSLSAGIHEIILKLKSSDVAGEAWNDLIDVMFVK